METRPRFEPTQPPDLQSGSSSPSNYASQRQTASVTSFRRPSLAATIVPPTDTQKRYKLRRTSAIFHQKPTFLPPRPQIDFSTHLASLLLRQDTTQAYLPITQPSDEPETTPPCIDPTPNPSTRPATYNDRPIAFQPPSILPVTPPLGHLHRSEAPTNHATLQFARGSPRAPRGSHTLPTFTRPPTSRPNRRPPSQP